MERRGAKSDAERALALAPDHADAYRRQGTPLPNYPALSSGAKHRDMLMLAECAVAAALLVTGGLAFRQSLRTRLSSRGAFWLRVGLGVLAGGYLSIGLVWQSETTRFFGAPLTAALFQRSENGYWEDYVGPLTLPAMLMNFVAGFFLPHLPAWVGARLRSR